MRRLPSKTFGALVAAGALIAGGALTTTATAAPGDSTATPTSSEQHTVTQSAAATEAEQQRVRDHWTPERMRSAVPVEELASESVATSVSEASATDGTVPLSDERTVAPTSSDSAAPGTAAEFPEVGAPWADGGEIESTAGRVFFTFNGDPASCSGNAVTSENSSTVMTAGHCVFMEGSWHEDWVFVPAYDNGDAPYGEWPATETMATPQWESSEDMNYDVGAAVVGDLNGESLTDVVGGQGLAFNTAPGFDTYAFGYPAADPYDGEQLIYSSGTTFEDPLLTSTLGLNSSMTGGSSGGPWFHEFDPDTGTGLQASVNSFGYIFLPNTMFGPQFGADAEALYETAQSS